LAPGIPGLREDLAWLVDRRVLSLPLATWPLPTALLEPALAAARAHPWPSADANALARVEQALARHSEAASVGLDVNSARHPALSGDHTARGAAEAALAVRKHGERWSLRLQVNGHAHSLAHQDANGSLDGSYAALALPDALLSFGAVDRWWGPGRYTSPILSDAAPPVPALALRRTRDNAPQPRWLHWLGPWGYELSLGQMRDYEPARAHVLGMRLYARPLPGLELGLSRHIQWGGSGRPSSLASLRDAVLGRSNISDPQRRERDDPSNELAGLDVRLSHMDSKGRVWVGHAQAVGDDEAHSLPSRFIGTAGLQLKHPWQGGRLEWSVEGTDTVRRRLFGLSEVENPRPAYTSGVYTDGYYHRGLPLGAHIGGGGRIYNAGLAWVPECTNPCRRYHLSAFHARTSELGPQSINASFAERGFARGVALRLDSIASGLDWHLALSVQQYRAGPRPAAGLQFGIEFPLQR
jgi:hypothetical protein